MDSFENLESVRKELEELEKQVAGLEQAKINAATIPAEELLYVHDRINEMHSFLRNLEASEKAKEKPEEPVKDQEVPRLVEQMPGYHPPEPRQMPPQAAPYRQGMPYQPGMPYQRPRYQPPVRERRQSRKLSEVNFGKYGAAGIAAVLILLAVLGFAGLVWELIPGFGKFLLVAALGGACVGFGVKRVLAEPQNGFWLAISSLGFGICYAAAACGLFVWNLYGSAVALVLFVTWFTGCFLFARRMCSRLVYTITYIGGELCLWFAIEMILPELALGSQVGFFLLTLAFLSFGLYSSGYFSFSIVEKSEVPKERRANRFVELCNVLLGAEVCGLLWTVEFGAGPERYRILLLTALLLLVSGFLIFALIRYVHDVNLAALLCVPPSISVIAASLLLTSGMEYQVSFISALVCLTVAALIWVLNLRDLQLAVWCTSFLFMVSLAMFSHLLMDSIALLVLAAAAMLRVLLYVAAGSERTPSDRHLYQKTCWAWYIMGYILLVLMMFMPDLSDIVLNITVAAGLGFPIVEYVFAGMDASRRRPLISKTWALMLGLLLLFLSAVTRYGDPFLFTIVSIVVLALHKFLVLERAYAAGWEPDDYNKRYDWEKANWLYVVSLWLVSFVVDGLTIANEGLIGVTSLAVLLLSVCYIYEAVVTTGGLKTALMMACSHLHIFMLVYSVGMSEFTILTSVMGLALCAGFLYLGFRRRDKQLRVMGLVTMMLYVLKITLVDISAMADSPALTIVMLLVGGVVCFGISYAYNKLSAKFSNEEELTDDSK